MLSILLISLDVNASIYTAIAHALDGFIAKETPKAEGKVASAFAEDLAVEEAKNLAKKVIPLDEELTKIAQESASLTSVVDNIATKTVILSEAFLIIELNEKAQLKITTNYVKDLSSSPIVLEAGEFSFESLNQLDGIAGAMKKLTGVADNSVVKRVKISIKNKKEIVKVFDPKNGLLKSMNEFSEALVVLPEGKILELENFGSSAWPRWSIKMNKCCVYTGIPPNTVEWKRLKNVPLDKNNTQVLSLFSDTKTEIALNKNKGSRDITHPNQINGEPLSEIKSLILQGKSGDPLIIIGHIEGESIKVEGGQGFEIRLYEIAKLAYRAKRPIFFIGCNTSQVDGLASGSVTTLNYIFPRKIASDIRTAIQRATNMQDFVERISSKNAKILMPANLLGVGSRRYSNMLNSNMLILSKQHGSVVLYAGLHIFLPFDLNENFYDSNRKNVSK